MNLIDQQGNVNRLGLFLILEDELEWTTVDTKSKMVGFIKGNQVFVMVESGKDQEIFTFEIEETVSGTNYKFVSNRFLSMD